MVYTYDADGRRVKQTIGAQVTNYLWDETSPYGDVVLETDSSGSPLASYVLGGTELLSQTRNGTSNYYLQDGQGSVRNLTNAAGNVTDSYTYTAFGDTFNLTGITVNPYQYTGQQYDALTGLYSLRARYYDPAVGRFLSQDSYPYDFDNPVQLNRYVYAMGDPVNYIDPGGMQSLTEYVQWTKNRVKAVLSYFPRPFFSLKAGWDLGLETAEKWSIIHIGNSLKYGLHIALGAVATEKADWHLYVHPLVYLWRPIWGNLILLFGEYVPQPDFWVW
jgi:RHS repeat-associated protein